MEHLDNDMAEWADNWWDNDFDWSVYESQKAHEGDRFFMVRVGEGNTGVFAAGRFTSEPYKSEDWSGKGREVYYMKMEFEAVFHPGRTAIISTLERRKLVCRSIDKHDKRQINITLTRAGGESLNALKKYEIVVPKILSTVFENY